MRSWILVSHIKEQGNNTKMYKKNHNLSKMRKEIFLHFFFIETFFKNEFETPLFNILKIALEVKVSSSNFVFIDTN